MPGIDRLELDQFLRDYPLMAIRPTQGSGLRLKGKFAFVADHPARGQVADIFGLEITVPPQFPRELPVVKETGGRIPRVGDFHVNADGSLCLGSPLRLLMKINGSPTLPGFAACCLVPFLYAISLKLTNGGDLAFGGLAHGGPGLLQDYARLFSLPTTESARYALSLLSTKKRIANKQKCPCGCTLRLGRCKFHYRLLPFRRLASRSWFQHQLTMVAR